MNEEEFPAVSAVSARKRYEYFVKKAADFGSVWALGSEESFIAARDDEGQTLLPLWPHPEFANASALGEWSETQPVRIELSELIDEILEDLRRDGRKVAVFHTPDGQALHVEPDRLRADLSEEAAKYG